MRRGDLRAMRRVDFFAVRRCGGWYRLLNGWPQRPQIKPLAAEQLADGISRIGKSITDRRVADVAAGVGEPTGRSDPNGCIGWQVTVERFEGRTE